jgi:CheY-like chemotaxis protein
VRANPADLREVLINLIFNAVDAMESSGTITLSTGEREGRVFACVRDEGVGMDAATVQRVFEPFFTTKGPRGHGFGLSTCWTVARALGGDITVESVPGCGSSFTLWLPIARARHDAPAELSERTAATAHLLLIDDDPEVLRTVRELLELLGHRVSAFGEAHKALEAIEQFEFDCVITDLGMPGLGGTDLARKLAQRRPELPILILTGWGRDAELAKEVADQVVAVLSKPITLEALRSAVSQALGG